MIRYKDQIRLHRDLEARLRQRATEHGHFAPRIRTMSDLIDVLAAALRAHKTSPRGSHSGATRQAHRPQRCQSLAVHSSNTMKSESNDDE